MKKKVLFICQYFGTFNTIGAIRPTKFAKYLSLSEDYEVTVVCCKPRSKEFDKTRLQDLNHIHKIYEVSQVSIYLLLKEILKHIFKNHEEKFPKQQEDKNNNTGDFNSSLLRKGADWINSKSEEVIKKRMLKKVFGLNDCYNVVFSTYTPLISHECAYIYKKKHQSTIWLADFRDPMYKQIFTFCGKKMNSIEIEKEIGIVADRMIGVTSSCFNVSHDNMSIINNGFDLDDLKSVRKDFFKDNKFHLSYTGRLYPGRKADLLFKALKELIEDKKIDEDMIQVDYAGTTFFRLYEQAKRYDMEKILVNHGVVSHLESLSMQHSSQMPIMLTWNEKNKRDVISGKIYEYMFSRKPILSIVSGVFTGSKTKEQITEYNLGFCLEEANTEDFFKMKKFILSFYNDFLINGDTCITPNTKVSECLYENKVKYIERIIEELQC